ncbi:Leucine-Rich Repeat Transmembrane Protein Flrt2, partial [Manis pentadactyla]
YFFWKEDQEVETVAEPAALRVRMVRGTRVLSLPLLSEGQPLWGAEPFCRAPPWGCPGCSLKLPSRSAGAAATAEGGGETLGAGLGLEHPHTLLDLFNEAENTLKELDFAGTSGSAKGTK